MNSSSKVTVNLGERSYDIHLTNGVVSGRSSLAANLRGLDGTHAVIVTDDVVAELYLAGLQSQLESRFERITTLSMPAGEPSKSVATMERLWTALVDSGADRRSVIVALGGGVPGDVAGFLAATFARGVRLVQFPTTLLAQVDSSVGGKTGINLPSAKNIVGAFWQPEVVVIDPEVLTTLSDREYQSGLAEVIKYGVIADAGLFEFLESNVDAVNSREGKTLAEIIARCCRIKAEVVAKDETESNGLRMILNYGHTYGHAIESVFGYGVYTHGAAVAIGMNGAARLAINLKIADTGLLDRQSKLIEQFGLPGDFPDTRHAELLAAMKRDKKVLDGKLNLILPTRIGSVRVHPAPDDQSIKKSFGH